MNFMELATRRHSCRSFSDQPVSDEDLQAILEAVRLAPTAKNLQPFRVHVARGGEALAKIDALTRCRFGAPVVLVFAYDEREEWVNPWHDDIRSGIEDTSIAACHAMFEAADLGLDTCWVNLFDNREAERQLGLDPHEHTVLLMPLGHAAPDEHPAHLHTERKPLEETVSWL